MTTLWAGWTFSFLLFEDLALGVVVAVTGLTAQAGVLPQSITGNTFVCFCLKDLAACLVLKLIILTQEVLTKRAAEDSASMIPHAALTLNAVCIRQGTRTGVSAQTFPAVAHPRFAEVTYCPHHGHSSGVDPRMLDHTI